MMMEKMVMTALVLSLMACGSEQKFKAGVARTEAPQKAGMNSEPSIDDKITALPDPVVKTTPVPDKVKELPEAGETFNECDKFGNAKIVADLYPSTEAKFYEMGQKPLTNLTYGSPAKTFCMTGLDIPLRNFAEGFPGYPDLKAWFILDIKFQIDVPEAGSYEILMDSDDGSIITVNGEELLNVDGLRDGNRHIYERRPVTLQKGLNQFRVRYFQGPGPDLALQFKWVRPGESTPTVIPSALIRKP